MRGPFLPLNHHPVDHDARIEIAPDHSEHPLVLYSSSQSSHKDVVVNPVKKFLYVAVNNPCITPRDVRLGLDDRLVRTSPRPEPVTVWGECGIEYRREHLKNGLLDIPVKCDGDGCM